MTRTLQILILVCALLAGTMIEAAVKVRTLMVAMRDGVQLATDVYQHPETVSAPVVLIRTPYNKNSGTYKLTGERFVAAGYAVVIQDCRGRNASEGVFIPYNNEGQDGFDTVEWLTGQTWCNGRIGMWGNSYTGATQWQTAAERPPSLVTITPGATWGSFYRNLYLGGALRLSLISKWAGANSARPKGIPMPDNWDGILTHLPLSELDRAIGWPIPWLQGMLTHPCPDGYWNRLDLSDEITNLNLPVQHIVGYYDFFSRESVGNFVRMQQHARDPIIRRQQQLILGPWVHGAIGKSKVGDVDFGPNAAWDATAANIEWFNRFLKQDPIAIAKPFTSVRYFLMGENTWQSAETWPPSGFIPTAFYLHSNGNANSRVGDGVITREAPSTNEPADSFRADPNQPTPACPVTDKRPLHEAIWGPIDQLPLEERADVLVYTSAQLEEPVTFAGNAKMELSVSANTPDADWVVKLVDMHPEGFAQNLLVGILRGRYRYSELNPTPLTPGDIYQVTVDLGPVAAQIRPGHRLRVDICGAYFPLFDRNTNTGEGPFGRTTRISVESIYHSPGNISRIILPCR